MTSDQKSAAAADVLADLRARLAAKERDLATFQAERKKLSLDAAQGDQGAIARRATLLSQSKAATELIEELHGAIDEARRRASDEAAAEAERNAAARRAEAERLAVKLLRNSERVDMALLSLGSAMAARAELREQLWATGVLAPAVLDRLSDGTGATFFSAVHAAGVARYLKGFELWGSPSDRPLSASDFELLRDVLREAPKPQPEPQAA